MNSVEKVKALCKERKIAIYRLEKDLGYANGYIGQLRKGTFPNDRLVEIANYLNVSTAYLIGEEQNEKPTAQSGELSEIEFIFSQLTPSRQTKLIELARLYLDDQRRTEETQ